MPCLQAVGSVCDLATPTIEIVGLGVCCRLVGFSANLNEKIMKNRAAAMQSPCV